jgi:glyoxylase-like metal-dependent hydrolase (beta-lactamase superfamily II)/ferredoxin
MASPAKRLPTNVDGDFFVDSTCIDCGTCRWVAPATFDRSGSMSRVHSQPGDERHTRRALEALVSCPVGSIGTGHKHDVRAVSGSFPRPFAGPVHHCGFHAESSFGAAAWLLVREGGNVLVDSPRYSAVLADRIEALGGVRWMFLTHRDDVADHERWAGRFSAERVLHEGDVTDGTRAVERKLSGDDPVELAPGLLVIPTPGHTRGSACLLAEGGYLFTGDHLNWSPARAALSASRSTCWYDWDLQVRSLERLCAYEFAWVLPGHGAPVELGADDMRAALEECVAAARGR